MVGDAAGDRVAVFRHVKPVHLRVRPVHFPPGGKLADRVHVALGAEKIAVQRQDHVGLVDQRHRFHAFAKRHRRRLLRQLRAQRLIDGPSHFRKLLRDLSAQPLPRRRTVLLQQQRQPVAVAAPLQNLIQRLLKRRRIGLLPILHEIARTIRVVQVQHRRLRKHVRRPLAHRMQRIALDLRRPPVVRRRHQRRVTAARRARGGVKQRLARNRPLHPARERHQMLLRPPAARETQPRQRHRRPHELHEIAARNLPARQLRGALRKLARQPAAKLRRVAELPERAPVLAARRGLRGVLENSFHR